MFTNSPGFLLPVYLCLHVGLLDETKKLFLFAGKSSSWLIRDFVLDAHL